ncbi:MAG: SufD family Fe-S cluster assembly protein [Bacilli bacterium]|nr:SufD family Fe-S cluster assembly protein [Bacilli bacterium]
MKQLLEVIDSAKSLIDDNEKYIIFNDGKAVETNADEEVEITVNESIDFSDYLRKNDTDLEKEIDRFAKVKTLVSVKKDVNLKIIHVCDDVKYINYQIDIAKRLNVNLTIVYGYVVNDAKIKLDVLIHHKSVVNFREYHEFSGETKINTSFYLLRFNQLNYKSLENNTNINDLTLNMYLLQQDISLSALNVAINESGKAQNQNLNVYHLHEDTASNFNTYAIANNNSVLNIKNIGQINKGCVNSDLKQKTKGILVDTYSSIEADPALIIDENDVLASHGASIGAIDPEILYYLMSRGLTKEESEKLIIEAYVSPYFKDYNETNLGKYILNKIK